MATDSAAYWQAEYDQAQADVNKYAGYKGKKGKERRAWHTKYKAAKKQLRIAKRNLRKSGRRSDRQERIEGRQEGKTARTASRQEGKTARTTERQQPENVAARQESMQVLYEEGGELLGDVATMVGSVYGADVDALGDALDQEEAPSASSSGFPVPLLLAGLGLAGLGAYLLLKD